MRPFLSYTICLLYILLVYISCTTPVEPFVSKEAKVKLYFTNLQPADDGSYSDTTGKEIRIKAIGKLWHLIDTCILYWDDDTTVGISRSDNKDDSVILSHVFTSPGLKEITVRTIRKDEDETENSISIDIVKRPMQIISMPADTVMNVKESLSWKIDAVGSGPLHYVWYRDGVEEPFHESDMLTFDSLTMEDAGTYVCTISNPFGDTAHTEAAMLTVIQTNRTPVFVGEAPDTLYVMRDGDTIHIPLSAVDADNDSVMFSLDDPTLPKGAGAAVSADTLRVWMPVNISGDFQLTVHAADGISDTTKDIQITVEDKTAPAAPIVHGPSITNESLPRWSWSSQGEVAAAYRYKLDSDNLESDATVTTDTVFIPPTDLQEGVHTFYIQQKDSNGNWSAIAAGRVRVDYTPPFSPEVQGDKITNDSTPSWSWRSVDEQGAGLFRIRLYSDDGGALFAADTVDTVFSPEATLGNGMWIFSVSECDSAGNWSKPDTFITVVDREAGPPPVVEVDSPTNNRKPTWSWTSGGGLGEYRYTLRDEDSLFAADTVTDTLYTPENDLEEGEYSLLVEEKDQAGNWSQAGWAVVVIDTTGPQNLRIAATSPTRERKPTWIWISGEGGCGKFKIALNEEDALLDALESSSFEFTPENNLDEGTHILYVQERDSAGNWSEVVSHEIVIDITPPQPPLVSGPATTNDSTPQWSWNGTGAGIYRYKLNSEDFSEGYVETSEQNFSPSEALSEGNHVLYVRERDLAGNWSGPGTFTILVDYTPPASPLLFAVSPTNDIMPTWNWTAGGGETDATFRYKLNDNKLETDAIETASLSFTPSETLSVDDHTFYIQQSDAAGNWSEVESLTVTIDLSASPPPNWSSMPVITNNIKPTWAWRSGGGSRYYRFSLDSSDVTMISDSGSDTSFTPAQELNEGLYTLYVQERDYAGNWSDSTSFELEIDLTPPAAPTDIAPALTNRASPRWSWVSGGGGCGVFRYKIGDDDFSRGANTISSPQLIADVEYDHGETVTIYVQESDIAGNWSAAAQITTEIDLAGPNEPLFAEVVSPTRETRPVWSWSSGGGDGEGTYRLKLNNSDLTIDALVLDTTVFTPENDLPEGEHKLYVQERDGIGNWSDAAVKTIVIDTTPPSSPTVSVNPSGETRNRRPVWSWEPVGGGTGIYRYRLNNPELQNQPITSVIEPFSPETDLQDGVHVFYVQERDEAGNWSESGEASVTIDNLPPSGPSITATTPTYDITPTWRWTSGNGGMGVYRYRLNNADVTTQPEVTTTSYTALNALGIGDHSLYVQERDLAGNWSPVKSKTVTIEQDPFDAITYQDVKKTAASMKGGIICGSESSCPEIIFYKTKAGVYGKMRIKPLIIRGSVPSAEFVSYNSSGLISYSNIVPLECDGGIDVDRVISITSNDFVVKCKNGIPSVETCEGTIFTEKPTSRIE